RNGCAPPTSPPKASMGRSSARPCDARASRPSPPPVPSPAEAVKADRCDHPKRVPRLREERNKRRTALDEVTAQHARVSPWMRGGPAGDLENMDVFEEPPWMDSRR